MQVGVSENGLDPGYPEREVLEYNHRGKYKYIYLIFEMFMMTNICWVNAGRRESRRGRGGEGRSSPGQKATGYAGLSLGGVSCVEVLCGVTT